MFIALGWLVSSGSGYGAEPFAPPIGFAQLRMSHLLSEPLRTIESPYGEALRKLAVDWKSRGSIWKSTVPMPSESSRPMVRITCLSTPGRPFYIGIQQEMVIEAPLARVREVVDFYPGYVDIFDGLLKAKLVSEDGNRVVTEWEERIAIPFVPNERNQVVYLISDPDPGTRIYRYGIIQSNHLKTSDGLIVVEAVSPTRTLYTEFDFFEPDLGAAKLLGADPVWRESVEGFIQTDLALKLSSEHSDWRAEEVRRQSKLLLKGFAAREIVQRKKEIPLGSL